MVKIVIPHHDPGFDPKRSHLAFCAKIQDMLPRAKQLLEMTLNNRNRKFVKTLTGATIIVAMAYLEQEVTNRLIGEIAGRINSQDGRPTLQRVKQELPEKFFDKLAKLPSISSRGVFILDQEKDATNRLRNIIRLRNQLIHDEGMCFIGPLEDFDWTYEGDHLAVHLPITESPWEEVRIEHAQSAVKYAEDYFVELEGMTATSSITASSFFKRTS